MIVEELLWQSFKTIEKELGKKPSLFNPALILVSDGDGNTYAAEYVYIEIDTEKYYQIIVDSNCNTGIIPENIKYWCIRPTGPCWEEM